MHLLLSKYRMKSLSAALTNRGQGREDDTPDKIKVRLGVYKQENRTCSGILQG